MDAPTRIRDLAYVSVGRACMFGVLAIVTTMSGFITWPVMAFKIGAMGAMFACVILLLKAQGARARNYRHTEVWFLLGREHGLPEDHAQRVIGGILRDTYLRFADYAGAIALLFWICALLFWLAAR